MRKDETQSNLSVPSNLSENPNSPDDNLHSSPQHEGTSLTRR
jgi:hypothetical protein